MKLLFILSIILPLTVVGCDPETYDPITDFDIGIITWTFNEDTGMVTIDNNSENRLSVFQSGTYSFLVEEVDGQRAITIDGILFDSFEFSQDQIFISQQYADGFLMTLTK